MSPLNSAKLHPGNVIRVIAPSRSLGIISSENKAYAIQALEKLGLKVTFGKNVDECDRMLSSSIKSRIEDFHSAFSDPEVKAILTVIGGYNSNQILNCIDYELIESNPKIFCGFSDITALSNALYRKTGLITYSGMHFSTFAMEKGNEYSIEHFKKIFFTNATISPQPSKEWSDDAWYIDQENRTFFPNRGYVGLQLGEAEGTIIGGNLGTLRLLQGTEYMPNLEGTILFLEEVSQSDADVYEFDRNLQALSLAPGFNGVKGIVFGRFETSFKMTEEKLKFILSSNPELKHLPILSNVDFGHTSPLFTFPVGGKARLKVTKDVVSLTFQEHLLKSEENPCLTPHTTL